VLKENNNKIVITFVNPGCNGTPRVEGERGYIAQAAVDMGNERASEK
jgi:hypothetical protein